MNDIYPSSLPIIEREILAKIKKTTEIDISNQLTHWSLEWSHVTRHIANAVVTVRTCVSAVLRIRGIP